MPSLTFVLPHWLYWAGLLLFPLIAMYLVARQRRAAAAARAHRSSSPICSGSRRASRHAPFLPARAGGASSSFPSFSSILYCNAEVRESPRRRLAHVRRARAARRRPSRSPSRRRGDADAGGSARRIADAQAERREAPGASTTPRTAVSDHWKRSPLARAIVLARDAAGRRVCCRAWCGGARAQAATPAMPRPGDRTAEAPTSHEHGPARIRRCASIRGSPTASNGSNVQGRRVRRVLGA